MLYRVEQLPERFSEKVTFFSYYLYYLTHVTTVLIRTSEHNWNPVFHFELLLDVSTAET